ncbi:MAG: LPP20 family lipoprotein [Treponema sp.]|nr:LPP20 family lipoprotein [Treponema sp.]
MKKTIVLIAVAVVTLLAAGCGSVKNVSASASAAPDWVLDGVKRSDAQNWYAVGEAKMPTEQNSLKMARMQARAELARMIKSQVNELVTSKETVTNSGVQSQELTTSLQVSTDALLQGSEQIGRFTKPDGTVCVLMCLPKAPALQKLNETSTAVTGKALFSADDLK